MNRSARASATAVSAIGYAWMATSFRSFTLPALAATLAGGFVAIMAGRRLPPPASARSTPRRSVWPWAVLAMAVGAWQLQAFLQHPRSEHPTFSSMTNDLLSTHPSRAAAMVAWLAAGVWLARR